MAPGWAVSVAAVPADSDDALLKMTITQQEFGRAGLPDLSSMTEEEQIAYAMQMSLQGAGELMQMGAGGQLPGGAIAGAAPQHPVRSGLSCRVCAGGGGRGGQQHSHGHLRARQGEASPLGGWGRHGRSPPRSPPSPRRRRMTTM